AVDAATGEQRWQYVYEPKATVDTPTPGAASQRNGDPIRGVALGHGRVYFGAGDNHVVAVDAATGREVWRTLVEDRKFGCTLRAAPLVVDDMVVVGSTGGETAHR